MISISATSNTRLDNTGNGPDRASAKHASPATNIVGRRLTSGGTSSMERMFKRARMKIPIPSRTPVMIRDLLPHTDQEDRAFFGSDFFGWSVCPSSTGGDWEARRSRREALRLPSALRSFLLPDRRLRDGRPVELRPSSAISERAGAAASLTGGGAGRPCLPRGAAGFSVAGRVGEVRVWGMAP